MLPCFIFKINTFGGNIMIIEIKAGNLINDDKESMVIKVYKKSGDAVLFGEVLFDLEGGKATTSIKSNADGKIESICIKNGDKVNQETVLARIDANKPEIKSADCNFNYFSGLMKPLEEEIVCDITIIGGGPGGYIAAIEASKLGANVVLIEKDAVGGTCLNYGCIPTKTFVRSAQVFTELKNSEKFGCYADNISFNISKMVDRKNDVVKQLVQGIKYLLDKHNVKVITGSAKLVDQKTVVVKNTMQSITIKTKNIIIATGSESAKPPITGIDSENVINSTQALELKILPKKMVIVGGGVIGMEFAYIFSDLGVDVSVIEYFESCLANCDDDICKINDASTKAKGIKTYTGSKVYEITNTQDNECIVSFIQNDIEKHVIADKVLVAVGRNPYFEGLDIEKLGIELNDKKKGIMVNSKMQTNIPNIYAIGDVTNTIQLAHVASHQGIVAAQNIMGNTSDMDYCVVPSAIFTEPEIAIVGICEKEAKTRGIDIEISKFPFIANGKAVTFGETNGFTKIIVSKESGKIIGGSIIGLHATDLIAEISLAIKNGLKPEHISQTIHAHPTTAEAIYEAALEFEL